MKPEMKYGLITGVGVSLWMSSEYLLGFHTTHLAIGEYTGYGSTLIPLVVLAIFLKRKSATVAEGRLSLAQGIYAGLYCSFIAALVVYAYMLAYNQFIHPGWLDPALEWKVTQLRAEGVSESAIRKEITFIRHANTPVGLLGTTLVGMTLLGGLLSLVITLFLRRRSRA